MCGGEKRKNRDAALTSWRPEGELASSSVYTNSAVTSTPPSQHSLLHLAALSPPPNQHLFVINTAECSAADSLEHLRSEKQNPLGWRRNEQERDRGSQTVCQADRQTDSDLDGVQSPNSSAKSPVRSGAVVESVASGPPGLNKTSSVPPSCTRTA